MKYTVLSNRSELKSSILEEKYNFIAAIISELGIDAEEYFPEDYTDPFQIRRLKAYLAKFNVFISFNGDDSVEIYFNEEGRLKFIAVMNKPQYILEKDLSQLDPEKRLYFKIFFNIKSIFEEESDG